MTEPSNMEKIMLLKPDFMGFIFHSASPRCIIGKTDPQEIRRFASKVITTGVFVDAPKEVILHTAKTYALRAIQLHGHETPDVCKEIKKEGLMVIKTFGIETELDLTHTEEFASCVDYFLFDTRSTQHGGTGKPFEWHLLKNKTFTKPWFLAGGIAAGNIRQAASTACYGLDLNSRFELKPGIKDVEKLTEAINQIRDKTL